MAQDNSSNRRRKSHGDIMSWLPTNDPILGDPRSCDALELIIVPRTRDLGDGFEVRIALPTGSEEIAPSFQHYAAADLPTINDRGFTARVIAGSSFGVKSPVTMVSPWFYAEVTAQQDVSVPLDPDHEERAIYLVDGEIEIAGERYEGPRLLIFRPGDRITVKTTRPTRMMFLGGDALEGPRHIWWNFVSSSKERIEQAKEDWKTGRFAAVPQEHELIPLPE